MNRKRRNISYFPGCSLATTATENNDSMQELCRKIGINLIEIPDWNCCGSSSTSNINEDIALSLSVRNLSISPSGMDLLVACPNCNIRLRNASQILRHDPSKRLEYEKKWRRPIDPNLNIISFFDLLKDINIADYSFPSHQAGLQGLKFVAYYGCMLAQPSKLKEYTPDVGVMEKILSSLGAKPISWAHNNRCCGTYLSVAKPDLITPIVNNIIQGAIDTGADCIVTACAMCQLNMEVRCNLKTSIPTMHFSELLSLGIGTNNYDKWFLKHLVDPEPIFQSAGLI